MNLSRPSTRHNDPGYALVMILISLAVMLFVFASIMYWASTNSTLTVRNNSFNTCEDAAESATENIMATMIRDFTYNNLGTASSYATLFPPTNGWPNYFIFSDTNGNTAYAASVSLQDQVWTNLNSQYNGLYGISQPCLIASTATIPGSSGITNLHATIEQTVEFALIPLFQFAVFYNMDLEASPGGAMTINGAVWSNGNIWSSPSGSLIYNSTVSASGKIFYVRNPNDPQSSSSATNVSYVLSVNNPLINESTLTMPVGASTNNNPTNVTAIIYPPPTAYAPPNFSAAYSTNGLIYLQNAADLIVSNAANGVAGTMGTNLVVYYQNPNDTASYLTSVQGDVLISSNVVGHVTNFVTAYSWVTNVSFYDYREGDTVQAVQVNVQALDAWLTNGSNTGGLQYNNLNTSGSTSKSHQINSIYVYNSVPLTSSQLPAVRMYQGQQLPPSGLTMVTPQPMYIKGNYNTQTNSSGSTSVNTTNTAYTAPAAIMADAVTILSSQWQDSWNSGTSLSSRTVTQNDTVNAALLVGIDPSLTDASGTKHYSGGIENYLRLLENWNNVPLWYNGSEVAMFYSAYATNYWQTPGNYYQVPTRDWGFDRNFMTPAKLPPLSPQVRATIRGYWYAW